MRRTYLVTEDDHKLYDRLRHRAYAYTVGYNLRITSVNIAPSFGDDLYTSSDEITFYDVTVHYSCLGSFKCKYVHRAITRETMEHLFRSTDKHTRYYKGVRV